MLGWRELNQKLAKMTEEEVAELLNEERTLWKRATVLIRLHQRLTILRAARERAAMLAEVEAELDGWAPLNKV